MKAWRWLFLLVVLVVAGAFAWTWLAPDPGYVLVRIRGTAMETSLVVAVALLLALWALASLAWRLLSWPFTRWRHGKERRCRGGLVRGLLAYAEGDYAAAERELGKAARNEFLRIPAQLALARTAHERGAFERASQALDEVGDAGTRAAAAMRARFLIDDGAADEALGLLKRGAAAQDLSPRGWLLLVEAALAAREPAVALDALPVIAKTHALTTEAQAALELRVLQAALAEAADVQTLDALWKKASRAQRRQPELIGSFARRSAQLGQMLAAMDEIEAALRREWSEALVALYGELGVDEAVARARKAEAWLDDHPDSPALLTALGRLHAATMRWDRAEELLMRALEAGASAATWEALGDCRRGRHDDAGAAACYANALRVARCEAPGPLPESPLPQRDDAGDARSLAQEERSEHGVPRLRHQDA